MSAHLQPQFVGASLLVLNDGADERGEEEEEGHCSDQTKEGGRVFVELVLVKSRSVVSAGTNPGVEEGTNTNCKFAKNFFCISISVIIFVTCVEEGDCGDILVKRSVFAG